MNKNEITQLVKDCALRHIAFIMDGNGRWATSRLMPREMGHAAGAKTFKKVALYCRSIGIEHCTVYAFSTENWNRPKAEVAAIMKLLDQYLDEGEEHENVSYRFIGDKNGLPTEIAERTRALEAKTAGRDFILNIALNYGGRAEIVNAVNSLIAEGKTSVTDADIASRLYTAGCPDPDLVVRTGNELRISNFLMWQSAYSELYFSDKMWPDFGTEDVDAAVVEFSRRKRRFGGLDKK
ncbi:MAG: di-trans,poly-cis-decaprenylcistransferase [Ruminococcaceae bacterium]|nr:di-trans,poly-cis-decaprenylcistransferase [Oscillospiraceae bacterium]